VENGANDTMILAVATILVPQAGRSREEVIPAVADL
jgi:hypothetical protein